MQLQIHRHSPPGYADNSEGNFHVDDHLFYECGPQKSLTPPPDDNSPLLVLIAGLNLSDAGGTAGSMPLELFQMWLYGNLADATDPERNDREAANVCRIIVAGNTVRNCVAQRARSNQLRPAESDGTLRAVCAMDKLFARWKASAPVDVMPGEFDPSNHLLPQQPMHQCMFPVCSRDRNFQSVTNPYDCQLAGRRVLGTSGQNVNDVMRNSRIETPLEVLRLLMRWSHLAPTAPDTLACFPFYNSDPFVIGGGGEGEGDEDCPHLLFAGNVGDGKFATDVHVGSDGQRTRLVCVPSFEREHSVAVVNLRTLECVELEFGAQFGGLDGMEE